MKDYIPYICWSVAVVAMSGAIGYACYVTKSAFPLLAFIFIPGLKSSRSTKEENDNDESES